jgi:nitroimidazol reductase NimA-like FMN-containing flavoprotein (pyridoxamine 5'-phosphate oxidase superfamily)
MDSFQGTFAVLRDLFARQRLGVLATYGPDHPYTSLVAVCADEDLRHLYFVTPRATRKFHNLEADARVAMLVDSRAEDDLDFHGAAAATAVGTARELTGRERVARLELFLRRQPQLRRFAGSPTTAFVELTVQTYYVVTRFQNVAELHLG